jgi:hypothetical protein
MKKACMSFSRFDYQKACIIKMILKFNNYEKKAKSFFDAL